jgi:prepilin-type N-terminal cleavage/methylation domain-containing protein
MHSARSGLTLVELMAAIAILSVIALVATGLFITGSRLWREHTVRTELNEECRRVLNEIARDLLATAATRISPPAPENSTVLDLRRATEYDPATDTVVFSSTAVRWALESTGPDSAAIVRYSDASVPATRRVITRLAVPDTGLAFTWNAGSNVMLVQISLRRRSPSGEWVEFTRNQAVRLRNSTLEGGGS